MYGQVAITENWRVNGKPEWAEGLKGLQTEFEEAWVSDHYKPPATFSGEVSEEISIVVHLNSLANAAAYAGLTHRKGLLRLADEEGWTGMALCQIRILHQANGGWHQQSSDYTALLHEVRATMAKVFFVKRADITKSLDKLRLTRNQGMAGIPEAYLSIRQLLGTQSDPTLNTFKNFKSHLERILELSSSDHQVPYDAMFRDKLRDMRRFRGVDTDERALNEVLRDLRVPLSCATLSAINEVNARDNLFYSTEEYDERIEEYDEGIEGYSDLGDDEAAATLEGA